MLVGSFDVDVLPSPKSHFQEVAPTTEFENVTLLLLIVKLKVPVGASQPDRRPCTWPHATYVVINNSTTKTDFFILLADGVHVQS